MLSNEAKKSLRGQLESFGDAVKKLGVDHREEARQQFQNLRLDGAIKLITSLEFRSEKILDLAAKDFSEYPKIFAVDGGSTRPKTLENGTTICAFQAVLCGRGDDQIRGFPIEAFRSLALVSHSHRLEMGATDSNLFDGDQLIHLWRIHLSRRNLDHEVERVVGGLARAASESYHILRMLDLIETDDSLFILDGNLYPIGLYYYFAGGKQSQHLSADQTWAELEPGVSMLSKPVRVVEAFAAKISAFAAINKNPGTSWLLEFTLKPEARNWSNDAQFIKAVLSKTKKDELGYTNWFVQEEYSLPQPASGEGPTTFDLFQRLKAFNLARPARDYHTCFFYVHDPRVQSVLKIEAPRVILENHEPERLRAKLLAEIACGKGVPPAIRRADSRARITTEEAEALIRACGIDEDRTYNQSRFDEVL